MNNYHRKNLSTCQKVRKHKNTQKLTEEQKYVTSKKKQSTVLSIYEPLPNAIVLLLATVINNTQYFKQSPSSRISINEQYLLSITLSDSMDTYISLYLQLL